MYKNDLTTKKAHIRNFKIKTIFLFCNVITQCKFDSTPNKAL